VCRAAIDLRDARILVSGRIPVVADRLLALTFAINMLQRRVRRIFDTGLLCQLRQ
jgi:hypothetical protein